jgi:titin
MRWPCIGTDVTGTQALGNSSGITDTTAYSGIAVLGGAHDNLIGGTGAGAGNLISGNISHGVGISGSGTTGNRVQGNFIGTDVTGTVALGNGQDGNDTAVVIESGAGNNTVGGTASGARNLISGNLFNGLRIRGSGTAGNVIEGNYIGTDVTGTQPLGNGADGIGISDAASGNRIGGTAPGAGNLIAANGSDGVHLFNGATGNTVQGNRIGTDVTGTNPLGNAGNGVHLEDTSNNNLIGGTAAGAGNTIAFNGNDGVLVDTATGNTLLSNLIFSSGNLGIELTNGGNNNLAAPALTSATSDGSSATIQGTLTSTPNTTFTLQFFADPVANASGFGEGQQLLGSVTVTTDASGFATFTVTFATAVPVGQFVSATATGPGGDTSSFAQDVTVSSL